MSDDPCSIWWQYECDRHHHHRCPRLCHHLYLCGGDIPGVVRQAAGRGGAAEKPRLPQPHPTHPTVRIGYVNVTVHKPRLPSAAKPKTSQS